MVPLLVEVQSQQGCLARLFPPIREVVLTVLLVGGRATTTCTCTAAAEAGTGTFKARLLDYSIRSIASFDQEPTATPPHPHHHPSWGHQRVHSPTAFGAANS
jgi:hypothetical protein